jgi:hypothetical protein
MPKTKILILSITSFADLKNGGGLWSANLLETMAQVPDTEFVIVSAGHESARTSNDAFVNSLGLKHAFIPFKPSFTGGEATVRARITNLTISAINIVLEKYFFPWEREARRQSHVDAAFMQVVAGEQPDIIVINYLFSALFAPTMFSLAIPRCLITLNNETAFHKSLKLHGGPAGVQPARRIARWVYRHFNWIPNRRIEHYENAISSNCAGIVALTQSDLPRNMIGKAALAVLPPIFKPSTARWSYHANRHIFFVGNIGYYPNRLAIEWICSKFVPELSALDDRFRLIIIGAEESQVPSHWRSMRIQFMGYSTKAEVIHQMTTANLFIAPIANDFGAKIKLAECVSFGMPFLATRTAMSGLGFMKSVPEIHLNDPSTAARLTLRYINEPSALIELSNSNTAQLNTAREEQTASWRTFYEDVLARSENRPTSQKPNYYDREDNQSTSG